MYGLFAIHGSFIFAKNKHKSVVKKGEKQMGFIEIILIGIGLSMDAVAVSMTNGMVYKGTSRAKMLAMPVFFGIFQGGMPLIGYFAGGLFADVINKYAGLLVFAILGIIGGKMLKDGLSHRKEEKVKKEAGEGETLDCTEGKVLTYKVLLVQAIATSIDAFAVGIGFSAMQVSILPAVTTIMVITALCCILAIWIGKKCGDILGCKSELLGGIILVVIAIRALL